MFLCLVTLTDKGWSLLDFWGQQSRTGSQLTSINTVSSVQFQNTLNM